MFKYSFVCEGCKSNHAYSMDLEKHKINCLPYYDLDLTPKEYLIKQSSLGKIVLVNKLLMIDFTFRKFEVHKCLHSNTSNFIKSTLNMNPSLEKVYEDDTIVILSDCITNENILSNVFVAGTSLTI